MPTFFTQRYNGNAYRFINKPTKDLLCHKCHQLAHEPHKVTCMHSCSLNCLYCKECAPKVCCNCNKDHHLYFDEPTKNQIQQLKIICPNDTYGFECSWQGELRDASHHRLMCPLEPVVCLFSALGCKAGKMNHKKLSKHVRECRDEHLDLAMRHTVSMTKSVKNMAMIIEKQQEQLKQHEETIKSLREEIDNLKYT